jgi:hypothetical protein
MLIEAAIYGAAALVHAGVLAEGFEHRQARIAETIIAVVLLAAAGAAWVRPAWTRRAGLAGQGFALLLTLVGLLTIALGIGPRTAPDIVYHIAVVVMLICGLAIARRA